MKYKLLALSLALVTSFTIIHAQNRNVCGYDYYVEDMDKKYPGYSNALDADMLNSVTKKFERNDNFNGKLYTIQVVFHNVYKSSNESISDALIKKQIDVLNRDYSATNKDRVNLRYSVFGPLISGDTRIRFQLATTKPDGSATKGIERRKTGIATFYSSTGGSGLADDVKRNVSGGLDAWDTKKYLNIWICNFNNLYSIGGEKVIGYATPPPGLEPYWDSKPMDLTLQGVVLSFEVVGDDIKANPPRGRTAVHEVGHYLGLRHVWGDKLPACGDDFIWDTPTSNTRLLDYGPVANNPCNGKTFKNSIYRVVTPVIQNLPKLPDPSETSTRPEVFYYSKTDSIYKTFLNETADDVYKHHMDSFVNKVRIEIKGKFEKGKYYPEDTMTTSTFIAYPAQKKESTYMKFKWDSLKLGGTYKKYNKFVGGKWIVDSIMVGGVFSWAISDTIIVKVKAATDSIVDNFEITKVLQPNSCNEPVIDTVNKKNYGDLPDFYEDYMFYSDEECTVAFTNAQRELMQTVILNRRSGIAVMTENAIEENYTIDKLDFYPNPANNTITLVNSNSNSSYQILNIAGSVVETGNLINSNVIDVSNLSNGIYTIQISSKQNSLVNKLVISK